MGSPVQWSVPRIVKPSARHSLLQALSHEVQVTSPSGLMEGLFHFFCLTLHCNNAMSVLYSHNTSVIYFYRMVIVVYFNGYYQLSQKLHHLEF
jgi:hypothetical protein